MSRLPKGLRKVAGGWNDPFRRVRQLRTVAPAAPARSQEELDAAYEAKRLETEEFIRRSTADFNSYVEQVRQSKALAKLVDAEARVAIEGDTDLNHDNVEGAGK